MQPVCGNPRSTCTPNALKSGRCTGFSHGFYFANQPVSCHCALDKPLNNDNYYLRSPVLWYHCAAAAVWSYSLASYV